jgi:hypothetical protein
MVHAETAHGEVCGDVFVHEQHLGGAELISWGSPGAYGDSSAVFVGTAARPAIDGTVVGPCLFNSLHSGANEIDVVQARQGYARFRSIVVYPDSGLVAQRNASKATRVTAAPVKIEPLVAAGAPRVGATIRLPFRLIGETDSHAPTTVAVRVRALGEARLLRAPHELRLPAGQGAITHGLVVLRPLRRGRVIVLLAAGDARVLVAWRVR